MKKCSKCGIEKDESEFSSCKANKDGLQYKCKKCTKYYHENNKESILERKKEYYENNKESILGKHKEYYENNKEIVLGKQKEYGKVYRENNKESIIEKNKVHYKVNKEVITEKHKEYRENNKEHIIKKSKEYRENNKESIIEKNKKYIKQRKKTDPLYKLTCNIRKRISEVLRNQGYSKTSKTSAILGCTFEEFKLHIEKQFTDGMDWTNQGKWHLDHIYPVSLAESEQHLIQLNHYTNFQPLWAEDNIRKSNKLPEQFIDN